MVSWKESLQAVPSIPYHDRHDHCSFAVDSVSSIFTNTSLLHDNSKFFLSCSLIASTFFALALLGSNL